MSIEGETCHHQYLYSEFHRTVGGEAGQPIDVATGEHLPKIDAFVEFLDDRAALHVVVDDKRVLRLLHRSDAGQARNDVERGLLAGAHGELRLRLELARSDDAEIGHRQHHGNQRKSDEIPLAERVRGYDFPDRAAGCADP